MKKITFRKSQNIVTKSKRRIRHGDIYLGRNPNNHCEVALPKEAAKLNLWCLGPPGSGKSVLMKLIAQDVIRQQRQAAIIIDWHGDTAESVVEFCSRYPHYAKRLVYFDPAERDNILGFNPMRMYGHQIKAERIGHLVDAIAQYMQQDVTETPRLMRWLSNIFMTSLASETTFYETRYLCDFNNNPYREKLLASVEDDNVRNQWRYFGQLKLVERRNELESSLNRLVSFVSNDRIRLMLGTRDYSIDFSDVLDNHKIVILNLSQRGVLSPPDASLLASLFLHELISAVRGRGLDKRKEVVVLGDEFHEYGCSAMIGDSFNSDRKFGLRWFCFHQTPSQLRDRNVYVYNSAQTGLQNRIVFGHLPWDECEILERDLFAGLHDLKDIKDELKSRKIMDYLEETRIVTSYSESHVSAESWFSGEGESDSIGSGAGHGHAMMSAQAHGTSMNPNGGMPGDFGVSHHQSMSQGASDSFHNMSSEMHGHSQSRGEGTSLADGESYSESVVPVWIPQFGYEVSSRQFYTLEEQRYKNIARLKNLPKQQAMCKFLQAPPIIVKIRNMNLSRPRAEQVERFKQKMFSLHDCFAKPEDIEAEIRQRHVRLFGQSEEEPSFFED